MIVPNVSLIFHSNIGRFFVLKIGHPTDYLKNEKISSETLLGIYQMPII